MTLRDRILGWLALAPVAAWVFLGEAFKLSSAIPAVGQLLLFALAICLVITGNFRKWSGDDPFLIVWCAAVLAAMGLAVFRGETPHLIYQDALVPLAFAVAASVGRDWPLEFRVYWTSALIAICSLALLKVLVIAWHGQEGVAWLTGWQAYADLGEARGRIVLRGGGVGFLAATAFSLAYLVSGHSGAPRFRTTHVLVLILSGAGLVAKATRSDAVALIAVLALAAVRTRHFARKQRRVRRGQPVLIWGGVCVVILLIGALAAGRFSRASAAAFRWQEARSLASERLSATILGEGFGAAAADTQPGRPTVYSHNYALFLLLKWGIAGTIAFHLLISRMVARSLGGSAFQFASAATVVALLAEGLFANQFASPTAPYLIGLMVGGVRTASA